MVGHPNEQFAHDLTNPMASGRHRLAYRPPMHLDVVFHHGGGFPTASTYSGRDAFFGHVMEFFTLADFSSRSRCTK